MKFIHLVGEALVSYLKLKIIPDKISEYDELLQSSKLLMYELYSNAVRHSPSKRVEVKVQFTLNFLSIDIETRGPEFIITPKNLADTSYHFPYPESILGSNFVVYHDSEEMVHCHVHSDSCLEFSRHPVQNTNDQDIEVPEHFGLLFLTTICNDVKYFRTKAGLNIFSVKKHFPQEALN